jgi:hypothetical protein
MVWVVQHIEAEMFNNTNLSSNVDPPQRNLVESFHAQEIESETSAGGGGLGNASGTAPDTNVTRRGLVGDITMGLLKGFRGFEASQKNTNKGGTSAGLKEGAKAGEIEETEDVVSLLAM